MERRDGPETREKREIQLVEMLSSKVVKHVRWMTLPWGWCLFDFVNVHGCPTTNKWFVLEHSGGRY